MAATNLIKLKAKTYIKMIENSAGTRMFNSAFVRDKETSEELDILNDGEYSCAFFVSGLLTLFGVMDRPHATVKTLVKKLEEAEDWQEVSSNELKAGDVIVWEEIIFDDGSKYEHIGFYLDKDTAVSTDWGKRMVSLHHPTCGTENGKPKRPITRGFRNSELL